MRGVMIAGACALALAGGLSGCATRVAPIEVTRFHLGAPIAAGSVFVAPIDPAMDGGLEMGAYLAAVERELARVGYSVVRDRTAAQFTADVAQRRGRFPPADGGRPPVTIGIGGGSFGGSTGVGGGIGFGLGGRRGDVIVTELAVRLKRRAGEEVVWEGRARSQAGEANPAAQPGLAADKLARALFTGFPGESGRTINVP